MAAVTRGIAVADADLGSHEDAASVSAPGSRGSVIGELRSSAVVAHGRVPALAPPAATIQADRRVTSSGRPAP